MHCFLFLHQNNNFLECVIINDAIYAELFFIKLNSDESLTKLIQKIMIYDSCNAEFLKASCIIFKLNKTKTYCIKRFSKQYCSEIIVNENEYFKYYQF